MDRSALYSSYRRYKADTDFVVTWLATNAAKCGYSIERANSSVTTSTAAKAGSRSPKPPQKRAFAGAQPPGQQHVAYTIDSRELVPMAQCIATSTTPLIEVPEAFAYFLKGAVSERKRHHKAHVMQHQLSARTNDKDSDCRHQHFIGVLETVQEVLWPKLPSRISYVSARPEDDRAAVIEDDGNIFNNLDLEMQPEDPRGYDLRREYIKPETTSYTVESSTDSKDILIAAIHLMKDVHRIRMLIQGIWRAYKSHDIDLVTASVTTNTAIDFIRNIQRDLDAGLPEPVDWHTYTCSYCLYLRDTGKTDPITHTQKGMCLTAARKCLEYLVEEHTNDPSGFIAIVSPEHMDLYAPPSGHLSSGMACETGASEAKLAMSMLPELYNLANWGVWQAEHEILRGLRDVLLSKKQNFWVTCAVQILVDIRHVLQKEVANGFEDLLRGSRLICSRVTQVLKFHSLSKISPVISGDDKALRDILELARRWTEKDYINAVRQEKVEDESNSRHLSNHYLLKRDPLWCGLLLYNFRMVAYEAALKATNSWTSVLTVAHLYNALRQTKALTSTWPAMEAVLCPQRIKELFLGSLPTNYEEFARRFIAALGLSSLGFASSPGRRPSLGVPVKPRELSSKIRVSWIFKPRYCDNDGRANLRPIELQQYLQRTVKNSAETRRRDALTELDPIRLLVKLGASIESEVEESTFDYFQLHRLCWKTLMDLKRRLNDIGYQGAADLQGGRELPSLACLVLQDSCLEQRLRSVPSSARSVGSAPGALLMQAAEVVESAVALTNH